MIEDNFEDILRKYHRAQGHVKNMTRELVQITGLSQGTIDRNLKNPGNFRTRDLQEICFIWSVSLEDTGRLVRLCGK